MFHWTGEKAAVSSLKRLPLNPEVDSVCVCITLEMRNPSIYSNIFLGYAAAADALWSWSSAMAGYQDAPSPNLWSLLHFSPLFPKDTWGQTRTQTEATEGTYETVRVAVG